MKLKRNSRVRAGTLLTNGATVVFAGDTSAGGADAVGQRRGAQRRGASDIGAQGERCWGAGLDRAVTGFDGAVA